MRSVSVPQFARVASFMSAVALFLVGSLPPLAAQDRPAPDRSVARARAPAPQAAATARNRAVDGNLLAARLAAGEYGPAVDDAAGIEDLTQRVGYLKQIVNAQRDAGELQGAEATASRIPNREVRSLTRGEIVRQRGASGGGVQADFTSLMNLISTTVQPDSWEDLSGPGSMMPYRTGVYVDPNGLMRQLTKEEKTGALESLGGRARSADLNEDLARPSGMRLVSLKRLERAVGERLETGRPILETMRRLAGLTQIKHIFVYPDDHEIVIAGPAEGWNYDESGRPVGRETSRPLLHLDDFVVVLRTFAPGGKGELGCSINTRDANLKEVKDFVEVSNKSPLPPGLSARNKWLSDLQQRLGLQDVVVIGVPGNTRVAQVLVEADYRMKLIGVAKLDGGKQIPSYFDLLKAAGQVKGAPLEALRWWLTMKYGGIAHNPDRSFFEIQDSSVLVQSENQFVNSRGQHVPTGVSEPVNRKFAENFTKHYNELAQRDHVFADLRNIFDMALVAAVCRQEGLHERADWELGAFASGGAYQPAAVAAPTVVESVMNHRVYGGKDIVVQVAGGVQGDILAIARDKSLAREDAALDTVARRGKKPALPEGRWWWDAKE